MFYTDITATEDKLGREPFAKTIAKNIVHSFENGNPSLTIALTGKWGCGKSTLMNFVKRHIENEQKEIDNGNYIVFNFNPWMFSGQKELQTIFLKELTQKIPDANKSLREFFEKFSEATKPARQVGESIQKYKSIFNILNKIFNWLTESPPIENLRKEIDNNLVQCNIRLFIFVDDIDRLTPDEIAEIFQLVKLNASFKNTYYILAYDKEYVKDAMNFKYKNNGESYLEKIIQVDYAVPEVKQEDIENIFFEQFKSFKGRNNLEIDDVELFNVWSYRGLKFYFTTLRDVYRYFNAIQLRLSDIYRDINIIDFLILEAIRLFEYSFYTEIVKEVSKSKYSNKFSSLPFTGLKDDSSRKAALFRYLILEDMYRYSITYNTKKRFIDPGFTDRYLTLSISKNDVSEEELSLFITQTESRTEILESATKFDRIKNLLRRLSNPLLKQQYSNIDDKIIYALIDFWDAENKDKEFDDLYNQVEDAIFNLISISKNQKTSFEYLLSQVIGFDSRFSMVRFMLLNYIKYHFGKDAQLLLYQEVKPMVEFRRNDIENAYKKILEKWISFVMGPPVKFYDWKLGRYFIHRYAQFFPEKYLESIKTIIASEYKEYYPTYLALLSAVIDYDTKGNPVKISLSVNDIIPESVRIEFINRLKSIDVNLLSIRDQYSLKLFVETFQGKAK